MTKTLVSNNNKTQIYLFRCQDVVAYQHLGSRGRVIRNSRPVSAEM